MALTRRMVAKQNENESKRKRLKAIADNDSSESWASLLPEILFSIVLRLGVVDFYSFSGVCKSWRALALENRTTFLSSRQPMAISVSTQVAKSKECWLEDCEGRRFMTILPSSSGRIYLGLASGYLILLEKETREFRLVNPITRHELHFPRYPSHISTNPEAFTATLAFSPTASWWVFAISVRFSRTVSFTLSSKQAIWTDISSDVPICNLQFFQGKIYTLHTGTKLCELRLDTKPTLTPLKMNNSGMARLALPHLSTMGEKLFVTGYLSEGRHGSVEVDFDQMKLVSSFALKEFPCFVSALKCGLNILEFWEEPHTLYATFGYFHSAFKAKEKRIRETKNMWYFTNKCLDVNTLHE